MTDPQWLSSADAARRLGVKLDTLYAYVSRGALPSHRAADGKASRFDRRDVEALLLRRRSKPAASAAAETVIASSITRIGEDGVRYRGQPVEALAATHSFEQVADLLWGVEHDPAPWPIAVAPPVRFPKSATPSLADRLRVSIAALAPLDPLRHDLRTESVVVSARRMIASVVAGLPVTTQRTGPNGASIAALLADRLGATTTSRWLVDSLDTILVLLADHELATSTYAVRVAASTRIDVYGTVLAGAACGGPLHTGASREVMALLLDAEARGAETAVSDLLRSGRFVPGFGHSIYRRDPRFVTLQALVDNGPPGLPARRRQVVADVLRLAGARVPVQPNVDYALASFMFCTGMRADAGEAVFLVARMAGWTAHTIEEYAEAPLRFRTKGLYVGQT